jgi:adenylate cyclase
MKLRTILVLCCLLATLTKAVSQQGANYAIDTAKVNKLLQASKAYFLSQPDSAILLSTQAKQLSEQAGYQQGQAYALKNMGITNYFRSNYMEALEYYNQSLAIFRSLKDNVGISNLLSNIGVVWYDKGDDVKALENYLESLRYAELANDKLRILTALNNVGGVYSIKVQSYDSLTKSNAGAYQFNLNKALEYYLKALPLSEELALKKETGSVAVNIGSLYYYKKEDEKALAYFNKSLKAYGNLEESLNTYNAIGKLYLREKKYDLALSNHNKALAIAKKTDNKMYLLQTLAAIGNVYKNRNELRTALSYYHQAEGPGVEIAANHELKDLFKDMAYAYASLSDYQAAFKYQALYTDKSTEVFNADYEKKMQTTQFGYDLDKKQTQINLLTKDQSIKDLQLKRQKAFKNALVVGLALVLVIVIVFYRDYRLKVRTNKLLDKQNMQIESLLLNILPQEVAHELQSTGKATPRNYEKVSVLFTDFKSFTSHAEMMKPDEVVKELNTCFMAFDDIIERHNLEKIKTIGDAYMCAGGIPTTDADHVFRIVKASLEIQDFVYQNNQRRKEEGLAPWEIRIGINVGPVVAGVVGKKKYAYDIWGSAVNIASRMESNGMPGQVNISSSVYELIKDKYACIYRGKIYAKNVGEIDMYFIDHEIERFEGIRNYEEVEKSPAVVRIPSKDLLQ